MIPESDTLRFPPAGDLMRLGEAARAADVSTAQLEYYIMVGLVRPTSTSEGQQRLFDRHAVRRIQLIHMLNNGGYPLREIRTIFVEPQQRRRSG